jgi:hypothetical protein
MTGLLHRARRAHGDERGAALIESLVASALLGLALVVLLGSYSTLAIAGRKAEQSAVAGAAIRAQAARIKAAPYQATSYAAYYDAVPTGLDRAVDIKWWDGTSAWAASQNGNGLELVTLTYSSSGSGASLTSLQLVKANR